MTKKLGLLDSTTIIAGSMIGSGIFLVSADIARDVNNSPGLLLMAWIMTAVITVLGALSYGELSAMMPKAGGQYIYLKEAFGPLWGFLYGWALFAVIQTGTIAAVAVAFAKFTGVFLPSISPQNIVINLMGLEINTQQLLAVAVVIGLTVYNFGELRSSAMLQNIFTISKILALLLLIILGLWFGFNGMGDWSHFKPAFPESINWATIGIFGAAMTGALFSADAWNNITYTAGEVDRPQRNLPLSLFLGTSSVLLLYILANIAYVFILPVDQIQHAENGRVATLMMQTILGENGKYFMAAMIMVSTFGCLNGIIFTAGRVYHTMARDGYFFKKAAVLNKNGVPANALVMQGIWASLLCFSGTYGKLLDYIMFVVMIFYALTIIGLFKLRITKPDMERPYKAFGYPVLPAIYIILAIWVSSVMFIHKSDNCIYGLAIVCIGIPIYLLLKRNLPIAGDKA
ncbi:MAG: APC family permease [Bacteroidota bacterium]